MTGKDTAFKSRRLRDRFPYRLILHVQVPDTNDPFGIVLKKSVEDGTAKILSFTREQACECCGKVL